jgi:hypothetical protein
MSKKFCNHHKRFANEAKKEKCLTKSEKFEERVTTAQKDVAEPA